MALVDDIIRLRDDSLSALDAGHDYYVHTKRAWRTVRRLVQEGHKFTIRNRATGSIVDEAQLSRLAHRYMTEYLASATFQHFVSLLERFVLDLLRLWLTEYPESLSGNQLKFQTVLKAADKDEIVAAVVQKEVLGVAYQRVAEWFAYLEKIAQSGCPSQEQIERLAEMKASRDVLVHNHGIANSIYVDRSMGRARFADGDRLELPEHYHRESWQLIKQVVTDVAYAGISKSRR